MKQLIVNLPDELSPLYLALARSFRGLRLKHIRKRKLTAAQLRRILGFETRDQLDGFLKEHEVWLEYAWEDLEKDRETHRHIGL